MRSRVPLIAEPHAFASDLEALSGGLRRRLADGTLPVFDVEPMPESAEG